jgi:DNA-binding response OmpR family regulator
MKSKILLVEDDMILSEMYKEKLVMEGFSVITAQNGKVALKKAHNQPSLILLDVMMPGANGFEVLKQLKTEVSTRDIPVIVLTNVGSEMVDNDKKLAMTLGAENYLVKSYHTPEEVIDKVKETLKKYNQ